MKWILIAAGCGLALWIIVRFLRIAAGDWASRRCFEKTYANSAPFPTLTIGSSYGFPTFRVEFPDQAALDAAIRDGANDRFVEAIGLVWAEWGKHSEPFDAREAIYFSTPEAPP